MKDDDTNTEDTEVEAEHDAEQDLDALVEAEEEIVTSRHAEFRQSFVLGGFVLSILLGGTLGVIGSKVFAGPDKAVALRAEMQQNLDALRLATQTQTKTLSLTNDLQKQAEVRLDSLQAENTALVSQVKALEYSITLLQNQTKTDLKTLNDRIAVLETLSGENTDVFSGVGSITSRLEALEERALEQGIPNDVSTELPEDALPEETLPEETLPEENLNVQRISVKPPVDPTRQAALDVLIDTFPRAKLLSAVKAQEQATSKRTGWIKQALSRHVRMGNANAPDPYVVIEAAEAALQNGHIADALEKIAQLNPPVRTRAAAWVKTAKKAAPQIEKTQ